MAREKRLWLVFLATLATFVVGVVGMTGYTLWLLQGQTLASHFQVAALTARNFENFLTQSLHATELTLVNASLPDIAAASPSRTTLRLVSILRNSPQLRSLSLLDQQDKVAFSTNPANRAVQLVTDAYFPQPQGAAGSFFRVGKPWIGRDFSDGHQAAADADARAVSSFIPVSLHVSEAEQAWTWLIALNPDYFINHMSPQFPAEMGFVEILRLDGVRLMSTRTEVDGAGKPDYAAHVLQANGVEHGEFEHVDRFLGETLTAYRTSSLYPLVVVTHLRRDIALQGWMTQVKTILGIVVPALLAICLLSLAFYRRQALLRAQRAESERLQRINAACVFTNTHEGIIITASDGNIMDVNDAFSRITGYGRDEVLGKNPRLLSSGRHDKAFYTAMWVELTSSKHWRGEIWNRRKDGSVFAELLTISAVADTQGRVQQYVALFSNITAIKEYQHQLEHFARYDALTNLPNRLLLNDRLQQAMAQSLRRGQLLALAFIDLAGFKAVNDQYGHDAGDHLLSVLAGRMKQVLRDGDTLARLGGDEFVAVLVDIAAPTDCEPLVRRLLDAAAQCVAFESHELRVSASIGVAFFPQEKTIGVEELLQQADQAMYQSKTSGKNRYQIHPSRVVQATDSEQ